MQSPFPVLLGCCAALACGCVAGPYHIGNESLFPAGIETVYVPVIESASFRRDLGERLTEAVIKEIERRTPYKVVGDPRADTILTAKIVGETKHLVAQSLTGDPRESEINFQVQVSWLDRRGSPVRDLPKIPLPADCVTVSAASDIVPEVGQSMATAQQRAIQRLAEQIVSLMEVPW
jgi:Lipopolysaccharide-assembly